MDSRCLNSEQQHLLERAQRNGYVTTDRRDEYDTVAEAYRDWCRAEKLPFLEIAIGDATSRITFSMIEADTLFDEETESLLRAQLRNFCLYDSEIVITDDFCIAERLFNERIPDVLTWLREIATEGFPAYL